MDLFDEYWKYSNIKFPISKCCVYFVDIQIFSSMRDAIFICVLGTHDIEHFGQKGAFAFLIVILYRVIFLILL